MLIEELGDAFKGSQDLLVHGCNCHCNFGAGFAKDVKRLYPEAFAADKATKPGLWSKLGTFSKTEPIPHVYYPDQKITICNAYTQFNPGPFATYAQVIDALTAIDKAFPPYLSIAMPRIGCGLGGLTWKHIKPIVEGVFPNRKVHVYALA